MSRVFIGIPTYNRRDYVLETIDSVRNQHFKDWRVVVSDNGSSPEIVKIVKDYVESLKDPRIQYYQQPTNGGEYGQGRYFIKEAEGSEYFMILHDDDWIQPDYLSNAVTCLDAKPHISTYVADPIIIDEKGETSDSLSNWYAKYHGREAVNASELSVLDSLMSTGFIPISATFFRTASLIESGFVDDDCFGNFPFELNVFLRLGENGGKAWYSAQEEVAFRFHSGALRKSDQLMRNPNVVDTMVRLFERRQFSGYNERRRRTMLGRLFRAKSILALHAGDATSAVQHIRTAISYHWQSKATLITAIGLFTSPALVRKLLPQSGDIAVPQSMANSK